METVTYRRQRVFDPLLRLLHWFNALAIVLVAVGLFAVAEVLYNALYEGKVDERYISTSDERVGWTGRAICRMGHCCDGR